VDLLKFKLVIEWDPFYIQAFEILLFVFGDTCFSKSKPISLAVSIPLLIKVCLGILNSKKGVRESSKDFKALNFHSLR
jgi:hypothetical protein